MPDNPEHLQYRSGVQGRSYVYGVAFEGSSNQPLYSVHSDNLYYAVCYISTRATILTIPAKVNCPTNWTMEYSGYLVAGYYNRNGRTTYECVDSNPETIPGTSGSGNEAILYHVEPHCGALSCPPYDAQKELTCVVCSR